MSNDLQPIDPVERKWGTAIHIAAFAGLLLPVALVLGPMLIWMLKKNESQYLNTQGKKAVNFQLTVLICAFAFVLIGTLIKPIFALAFVTGLAGLVFSAMAAFTTYQGREFSYPFSFKVFK